MPGRALSGMSGPLDASAQVILPGGGGGEGAFPPPQCTQHSILQGNGIAPRLLGYRLESAWKLLSCSSLCKHWNPDRDVGKASGSYGGRSPPEAGRDLRRIHRAPAIAAVLSLPEAGLHEGKQLWLQGPHHMLQLCNAKSQLLRTG